MITPLPTPPSRQDPANFSTRADSFLGSLPAFVAEANALAVTVGNNTDTAVQQALDANAYKADAEDAAAIQLATANFVGNWSAQTGAAQLPRSVRHLGVFWALLNPLADITTSEPGITADWASINASSMLTQIMTSSVNPAIPGVRYICRNSAYTLTLPITMIKGQVFGFLNDTSQAAYVNTNGHKFRSQLPDNNEVLFQPRQGYDMTYEDASIGVY